MLVAVSADRYTAIDAVTDPEIPLLPPFPHGRGILESVRTGLRADGDAGSHALELLETHASMKECYV